MTCDLPQHGDKVRRPRPCKEAVRLRRADQGYGTRNRLPITVAAACSRRPSSQATVRSTMYPTAMTANQAPKLTCLLSDV